MIRRLSAILCFNGCVCRDTGCVFRNQRDPDARDLSETEGTYYTEEIPDAYETTDPERISGDEDITDAEEVTRIPDAEKLSQIAGERLTY